MDQVISSLQPARKPDAGTRIGSGILDLVFAAAASVPFMLPTLIASFDPFHKSAAWTSYLGIGGFLLYFMKDCFNGRSPGKRLMKLQVVDRDSSLPISPVKSVIRNIPLVIWPLEAIITLANPSRRLGDRFVNSQVIVYVPGQAVHSKTTLATLVPALLVALVLCLAIHFAVPSMPGNPPDYVESSYNKQASDVLQQSLRDSLGQYLEPEVKVYDKVQDAPGRFIAIRCELKANFLDDESNANQLKDAVTTVVYNVYPPQSIKGQISLVQRTGSSYRSVTSMFGRSR